MQVEMQIEGGMKDSQFMTAGQKRLVLKQWSLFLESGLQEEKFTKALYEHLHLHCSFIAHYDKAGFYQTYFTSGDRKQAFLSQFDERNAKPDGIPPSIEYGGRWWVSGEYEDINRAMVEIGTRYIPLLIDQAKNEQRQSDLAHAAALLRKHGIGINIDLT